MKSIFATMTVITGLTAAAASAQLTNPGFETGDFTGWLTFGQGWRTGVGADAYSGTYGVVNDVLTNDTDAFRGVFQEVPVTEGAVYNAGVFLRTVNIESSETWFELQWLNSGGGIIAQLQSTHVTNDQPFTRMALDDLVAPAGAVTASVRGIVFMPAAPVGGADFPIFDDFFLVERPALSAQPLAPDMVVLSWPTNATGFQLENATNVDTDVWSIVPDTPGVIAGNFVVTNSAGEDQRNFRLFRP